MGLDRFAKAQRRNPDKATCWACMENRLNTEPGGGSSSGGSGGDDDDDDSEDSEYGTVAGTFSTLSVSGSGSGGVALGSKTNGSTMTGLSSSGGVKAAPSAPSVTSSVATTSSLPPHLRAKGPASVVSDTSSKFAKVKAKPQKITMDAAQRVREANALEDDDITVQSDDSD
ncbi:hypothetical protein LTR37_021266 [Vermiconidia calcicola]|uniref:Uncharacterized protein n=1 Tax=Vermiconidia calcicola TaxID=1690605 RepID=A0ACC3M9D0_9PEZI|nr:hypothetical protein LTR37_021266 [Vermiconidia calcicola]